MIEYRAVGQITIKDYLKEIKSFKSDTSVRVADKECGFTINMPYNAHQKPMYRGTLTPKSHEEV